jgi:hypothetical protein
VRACESSKNIVFAKGAYCIGYLIARCDTSAVNPIKILILQFNLKSLTVVPGEVEGYSFFGLFCSLVRSALAKTWPSSFFVTKLCLPAALLGHNFGEEENVLSEELLIVNKLDMWSVVSDKESSLTKDSSRTRSHLSKEEGTMTKEEILFLIDSVLSVLVLDENDLDKDGDLTSKENYTASQ